MDYDPDEVLEHIADRWAAGDSIGEVITSVRRRFNVRLTAEEIQPTFARLGQNI